MSEVKEKEREKITNRFSHMYEYLPTLFYHLTLPSWCAEYYHFHYHPTPAMQQHVGTFLICLVKPPFL